MADDFFQKWCTASTQAHGNYRREILSEEEERREKVAPILNEAVQKHYVDPDTVRDRLQRLGYKKAAKRLNTYLPLTAKARSGDLGEILATEYVNRCSPFRVPLFRLRWKDGRNMALRGDDLIGIGNSRGKLQLLKGEVKSRRKLVSSTVRSAVRQLRRNGNRPTAHTVNYVIDRLLEIGKKKTASLLDGYMDDGISAKDLHHMVFTLSSNDPTGPFDKVLGDYSGKVKVSAVGLVITDHAEFVKQVYRGIKWQAKAKAKSESSD